MRKKKEEEGIKNGREEGREEGRDGGMEGWREERQKDSHLGSSANIFVCFFYTLQV